MRGQLTPSTSRRSSSDHRCQRDRQTEQVTDRCFIERSMGRCTVLMVRFGQVAPRPLFTFLPRWWTLESVARLGADSSVVASRTAVCVMFAVV